MTDRVLAEKGFVILVLDYDGNWAPAVNWKTKEPVVYETAEQAANAAKKMPPFGWKKAKVVSADALAKVVGEGR